MPAAALRTYRSAGRICTSQSSTETRKLDTMIAIATIRLKLDSTPPSAMAAWPEALASRASVSAGTGRCLARAMAKRLMALNTVAATRGIMPMPPISSSAMAQ